PTAVAANGSNVSNVSCNGGGNGSVTVAANGGIPGYNYAWSPAGGNSLTANNLPAGTYTVTVTDNNGCSITSTAVITEPTLLVANSSQLTSLSCFGGSNASAVAAGNGGTPAYNYSWSPAGGNSATANNLSAGNYTVAVTDANGCAVTTTVTITEPTA